jgi:hypothetical protein
VHTHSACLVLGETAAGSPSDLERGVHGSSEMQLKVTKVTTLAAPTPLERDATPRPLPWRRMAWITWRHHRIAMGAVAVFLSALAVWLWIVGLQLHHAYAAAIACHPAGSTACSELILNFRVTGGILKGGFVLQPVPALIGAFVGPQVLAREVETGTFRFAWTQGFGRWRWTLAKLVMLGVAVAAFAGAFSVLVSWYYQPYLATGRLYDSTSPLHHWLFDLRGVAFTAWASAAFAIGAIAGMLIRRVVPAIVATLAGYTVLAVVVGDVLRADYQPASHFWSVQGIEGGGLFALSLLLIGATVWQFYRRAA